MNDQKYYLCTFLRPGNVYDSVAMAVDPITYMIDEGFVDLSLLYVYEITEEQYIKLTDVVEKQAGRKSRPAR